MFAFEGYLPPLFGVPASSITVQELSGGLTNHTCRVIFRPPVSLPALFSSKWNIPGTRGPYKSLICKYAPPYISSVGPQQPLSVARQDVEARALLLLENDRAADFSPNPLAPGSLSRLLEEHPTINIPVLLYHDVEQHVLILTDLGDWPTLATCFTPPSFLAQNDKLARASGSALGAFLATLHCKTAALPDDSYAPFHNEDAARMVYDAVATLPKRLLREAGIPDADELGSRVEKDMSPAGPGERHTETCFGMVDLWVGSVLVGPSDGAEVRVGLVDWEYAGRSSAGSEMGMLTAHLCIPLHTPSFAPSGDGTLLTGPRTLFITHLLSAYRRCFGQPSVHFARKALLAHGRELINAVTISDADLGIQDVHRDVLLKAGARFLRAAGDCETGAGIDLTVLQAWERDLLKDLLEGFALG